MSDSRHSAHGDPHGHAPDDVVEFDSEIAVRRILEIGAWLAAITVGSLVVGYFIYKGLGSMATKADPKPSPLPEASRPVEPPSPRLQIHPETELLALRQETQARLASWGWVDRSTGVAHMPIEDAISRLAVPDPAPAPAASAPAPAAEAPEAPHAAPGHDAHAAPAATPPSAPPGH